MQTTESGAGDDAGLRILVVEDNAGLMANLFAFLEQRGHLVDAAPDGRTGLHLALTQRYDVMVLDRMLPRMDGLAVLRALRDSPRADLPVLMLTALGEVEDRISGLEAGADDYLGKPFALRELELRLRALAARTGGRGRARSLQVADLELDLATQEARRGGQLLHLYPVGRTLLQALMRASPAVVPRSELEHALWGEEVPPGDPLRSHIYDLRRAVDGPFERKLIHTVPKLGYRMADEQASGDG